MAANPFLRADVPAVAAAVGLALAGIKGRRIGQKGASAQVFDAIHDTSQEGRTDVGVPAFFTKMDLYCGQIAAADHLVDPCLIDKAPQFVKQILPVSRTGVCEVDGTFHDNPSGGRDWQDRQMRRTLPRGGE
jgi:hypothetical protein